MLRHRNIHIYLHRTHDAGSLRAKYDDLIDRMLRCAADMKGRTGDREWREELHPRADDGRFGNKAGEHEGFTGEKPTTAEGKTIKDKMRHLLSSGHPFTKEELKKLLGIERDKQVDDYLTNLKNPKYAGPKGALQIVKNPDGHWTNRRHRLHLHLQRTSRTPASAFTAACWKACTRRLRGAMDMWTRFSE
jgi:hypothetical protein